jgi:uncharacterized membrane protein YhhN
MIKKRSLIICLFLILELVAYYLILTAGGTLLVYSSFGAIVLCFVHALLHFKTCDKLILGGLACTVGADFCLVICSPIQQLWGMVFFLVAQSLYATRLHLTDKRQSLLWSRFILIVIALAVTILVLRDTTDALALVSLCYYANLIFNLIMAFLQFKKDKLFPIALVLFLLCDTVIGLQVACGGYLPIAQGSLLHRIIFMPFNLSWFFYLPSQVLISLRCVKNTTA